MYGLQGVEWGAVGKEKRRKELLIGRGRENIMNS